MKKIIRLTESDLHRIIKNSVKRVLREHDADDPDYGQFGDYYDSMYYKNDVEHECSTMYWIDPTTGKIMDDGEEYDCCVDFCFVPELFQADEYGYGIDGMDFEFNTGNEEQDKALRERFRDIIYKYMDENFDTICKQIRDNSNYTIYSS